MTLPRIMLDGKMQNGRQFIVTAPDGTKFRFWIENDMRCGEEVQGTVMRYRQTAEQPIYVADGIDWAAYPAKMLKYAGRS